MIKKSLVSVLALGALVACQTIPPFPAIENILPAMSDADYNRVIKKYTVEDKQYNGFHNTYQVWVTIKNSEVYMATLQRLGHYMQWEPNKARTERERMFQEMSADSSFFISFYAPEKAHDDLHKKAKTIWKIYLEHDGIQYEGKVKKSNLKLIQVKTLFYYHNRFSSAYEVTFNVPMTAVEKSQAKLIFTSSLGQSVFTFPTASKY